MYKLNLTANIKRVRINYRYIITPHRVVHYNYRLLNKNNTSEINLGINNSKQILTEQKLDKESKTSSKKEPDTKKRQRAVKGDDKNIEKGKSKTSITNDTNKDDSGVDSENKTEQKTNSKTDDKTDGGNIQIGPNDELNPVEITEVNSSPEEARIEPEPVPDKDQEVTEEDEDNNSDNYLTTIFEKMEPYMDTYQVYKQLTESGFTNEQADEIIRLLIVQLNTKLFKLTTKYSHLYELENEKYLFESAQQELRVDITRSRELHINELLNLIQILERDYNIIQDELNNDLLQLKTNNEVTINDQKQENTLQSKRIILKIQETNHKITTELNSYMRSEVESLRWHLSRWGLISILICVFSGCASFYIYKRRAINRSNNPDEFIPLVIYEPSEFDEDDYHTDLDESVVN